MSITVTHCVVLFPSCTALPQDELEASIDRVAHTLSESDTKLVTMEENRAAVSGVCVCVCACVCVCVCRSELALFTLLQYGDCSSICRSNMDADFPYLQISYF